MKAFLQKAHRPLGDALRQIEGKVEFDVEAEWNGGEIFRLIEEQDEKIRKYKEHIVRRGQAAWPGRASRRRNDGRQSDRAAKGPVCQGGRSGTQTIFGTRELVEEPRQQTVFNAAFLVLAERTKPFEEAIYRLGNLHGRILKFRYAGPLPCYSFVNLHVMMVEFQAVDEARRTLGLGDHTTLFQIKQAFRKLAPQCHPDRNDERSASQENNLRNSPQAISSCWVFGRPSEASSSQAISLTQERVGKTMLVISKEPRLASQTCDPSQTEARETAPAMSRS